MTPNFFDKLVARVRGRSPLVSAKLETMLVYTRGTGEPTPELALSRVPAGATGREEEGGDKGRGGGGQGGGGDANGAGGGEGGAGPGTGPDCPSAAAEARGHGRRRSTAEAAPRPPLQISIGKLELHAAPPARKPEPAPPRAPSVRLSDYLDRRR